MIENAIDKEVFYAWASSRHWAMDPNALREMLALISTRSTKPDDKEGDMYDCLDVQDGVATINISGPIFSDNSFYARYFGASTASGIQEQIKLASSRDDVGKVIFRVNSPGGDVNGIGETARMIRDMSKPTVSHIQGMAASAGYWLASQADSIEADENSLNGNIGVYRVMVDSSKAAENAGEKVHLISSGEYKGAGTEGVPVTKAQLADAQRIVDARANIFFRDVSKARNIEDMSSFNDGRIYMAQEALNLGLIDKISSFEDTLASHKPTEYARTEKPNMNKDEAKEMLKKVFAFFTGADDSAEQVEDSANTEEIEEVATVVETATEVVAKLTPEQEQAIADAAKYRASLVDAYVTESNRLNGAGTMDKDKASRILSALSIEESINEVKKIAVLADEPFEQPSGRATQVGGMPEVDKDKLRAESVRKTTNALRNRYGVI